MPWKLNIDDGFVTIMEKYERGIGMKFVDIIINNGWVVGIGTGIIVYIITSIITNKFSKKGRIEKANRVVLDRLRAYIVNNGVPSIIVFNAVKNTIADEHKVLANELLDMKKICEYLIAEIIGNTYIPTENQKNGVEILERWISENESEILGGENNKFTRKYEIIAAVISVLVGMITGMISK